MERIYKSWLMMLVLALGMGLNACGSDDDEPNAEGNNNTYTQKLVGTWKFTSGTETVADYTFNFTASDLNSMKAQLEAAMGERITIWDATLTFTDKKVNGVPFKIKGFELVLEGMEGTGIKITIKKLTDVTLVLHEDFTALMGQTFVADLEYHKKTS